MRRMTNSLNDEWRRAGFFSYFRQRLQTGIRSDLPLPDRLLFLSAALDALASHWFVTADRSITPATSSSMDRMRLFLLRHGHHPAFERVSAPMLRNRSAGELGNFPFADYKPLNFNRVRDWRDDPTFQQLEVAGVDHKLILRWSYPGILYVDFRCAWVHRFFPDNDQVKPEESNNFEREEPYYRYIGNMDEFRLYLPVPFVARTVEMAIDSFEKEADARNILPFKE